MSQQWECSHKTACPKYANEEAVEKQPTTASPLHTASAVHKRATAKTTAGGRGCAKRFSYHIVHMQDWEEAPGSLDLEARTLPLSYVP